MKPLLLIKDQFKKPATVCDVRHVCDQAFSYVSVTSVGGGGGRCDGSKFLPLNFNTSFQFVFHKSTECNGAVFVFTAVSTEKREISALSSYVQFGTLFIRQNFAILKIYRFSGLLKS